VIGGGGQDWGDGLTDLLVYIRAIHFAATLSVAGAVFFSVFIAQPAFHEAGDTAGLPAAVRRALRSIAWLGLAFAVVSGAAWLVVLAQAMSDRPLQEVFSEGILWIVLLQTGFGHDWLARFILAVVLAALFVPLFGPANAKAPYSASVWVKVGAVLLAASFAGTLTWAGHAAGGSGAEAVLHPAADFLHLVAAAAWAGTLLPLALLLTAAGADVASITVARTATTRFSGFGVGSVATLLVTGSINGWYLAGSVAALTQTDYGRLLLSKIALFVVMVAVAAHNRLRLTPRLVHGNSSLAAQAALRQLRRTTAIEIAIGAAIIAIVSVLGTNPPGLEAIGHPHHYSH
jgi:copper resistance protein D